MVEPTETLKAAALENGDLSQLRTKNIDGRMFLMLASEFKSSDSESEDSDTDSCNTSNQSDIEILDSDEDEEITVSLLDENGQEMEDVSFNDNVSRSSEISVSDLLNNLPAFPEFFPEPAVSKIPSITLPTATPTTAIETLADSIKILPVTSSSSITPSPNNRNTYIIKTSMPLSSLDLKSLIYSAGLSRLAPKTQSSETITKTPVSIIYPKPFSTDHTYVSTYRSIQPFSSSSPPTSLLSQRPTTATTNLITAPISSVNHINSSLSEKPLLQSHSSSLNTNNSVFHVHVSQGSKLGQALTTPIANTTPAATTQLVQSFPIPPANVIKPVTPVIDTGQLIPKVQISNTNMVGSFLTSPVTSQALASNVQSKTLPSGQLGHLLRLSSSNSNSYQMSPCLLISNLGTNTSTQSVMKKPIVNSGFLPHNLVTNLNQGSGQTTIINNVASSGLPLTRPISTPVLTTNNNPTMVQNTLQPTAGALTSLISQSGACINKTDSNSFTTLHPVIHASSILSTTTVSSSTSSTILATPYANSTHPLMVKIVPKSATPTTESILNPKPPVGSSTTVAQAQIPTACTTFTCCTTSMSSISNEGPSPPETNTAKDNTKEAQVAPNMTINNSLLAATVGDSPTNLDESKTAVSVNNINNLKSIWVLTPSEASNLFPPTTTTITSVSMNADCESTNTQQSSATIKTEGDSTNTPSIILNHPLITSSANVTPATNSADSSANVNTNSSLKDQELDLKANPEQTNSAKIDDTVQFLKLGSFKKNTVKVEPDIDGVTVKLEKEDSDNESESPYDFDIPPNLVIDTGATDDVSDLKIPTNPENVTIKTENPFFLDDATKTDQPSLLKIPTNLMNETSRTDSRSVLKIPVSLVNDTNKTDNGSLLKMPTSLINNNKTDNLSILKIPTSLVNVNHKSDNAPLLKVPISLLNNSKSKLVKPNILSKTPNVKLTQATPGQIINPAGNTRHIITVPNTVINSRPGMTFPRAPVSSSAPVVNLSNLVSSPNQQFLRYAGKSTGTQVLSFPTQGSQVISGSQVVTLSNQAPTATVFVALPGSAATGTKLVTLASQVPAGTRFVTMPSQAGTGTKLVALPLQTPTGTQLVTLPNQAQPGTRFVAMPSQAATGPKIVRLPNHTSTGSPVVSLTSQASTTTHLATLTSQAPTGSRVVTLATQAPTGAPQLVPLTSQASAGPQRVSLINTGTSRPQFVPITNQNLSGNQQMIRLPSQVTPGMRLSIPNLNKVVKRTASCIKILPLNNSAVLQLSQMAKPPPQMVSSTTAPSNNNGQTLTPNTTNKPNSDCVTVNLGVNDILKKLQKNEKCIVVSCKGGQTNPSLVGTTTAGSAGKVSMQSLLHPNLLLKNQVASRSFPVPPLKSSPPKNTEIHTKTEQEEDDMPLTLKIDSIYSLKDEENKADDFWETALSTSPNNKVTIKTETGCGTKVALTSQASSPPKYERVSPNMKPLQLQQKGVSSNNASSETEETIMRTSSTSPSKSPIVYARLNKPKTTLTPPVIQKHFKLHDLSNHFPLSQRKRFLDIGRSFRPEMMKSIIKTAEKATPLPIKGRIHLKEVWKKKYAFLQPRVMLSQLYIPARMKSVFIKQLPAETIKSLKCQKNCIHRVRASYPNGKIAPGPAGQNFMVVKMEGNNITPYFTGGTGGTGTKPNFVLKDNSNVPVSISSAAAQKFLLKHGLTSSTNIFTVPSANVSKLGVGSLRSIAPSAVPRKDSVQYSSQHSANKDDALSLACGIIQDNTLKRKSTLSLDGDGDIDWSMAFETEYLPYKKKR